MYQNQYAAYGCNCNGYDNTGREVQGFVSRAKVTQMLTIALMLVMIFYYLPKAVKAV